MLHVELLKTLRVISPMYFRADRDKGGGLALHCMGAIPEPGLLLLALTAALISPAGGGQLDTNNIHPAA